MPYNPNIHHRKSIRLKGYDYSQAGLYFITICTHNRECFFGEIVGANNDLPEMILNDAGKIANDCWFEIPQHFPNAVLHEHIVMPNHVHGIIELTDNVGARHGVSLPDNTGNTAGTSHGMSLPQQPNTNQFGKPIAGSVSVIINQYKSSIKRWCNKNGHEYFKWQSRFHDHIIRNEQSYQIISEYIINNPAKWQDDKFYK
ncbi:MAG: hypothetical protein IT243_02005 [Bacteroidia bacterium]|nr:hypothetical protein [Bacteroidia bacterium]